MDSKEKKKSDVTGSTGEIVVLFLCAAGFAVWAWFGIDNGIVSGGRSGGEYSLKNNPLMYLLVVGLRIFLFSFCAYWLFKSIEKKVNN